MVFGAESSRDFRLGRHGDLFKQILPSLQKRQKAPQNPVDTKRRRRYPQAPQQSTPKQRDSALAMNPTPDCRIDAA
jgi:hypothetical protein